MFRTEGVRVIRTPIRAPRANVFAERFVRSTSLLSTVVRQASVGAIAADTVLLVGQPAEALMEHAAEDGYEVLVVGRRGHGASNVLLGSTATRLVEAAGIPVLVV